nr:n-methyltransferase tcpn [Quercus suber]
MWTKEHNLGTPFAVLPRTPTASISINSGLGNLSFVKAERASIVECFDMGRGYICDVSNEESTVTAVSARQRQSTMVGRERGTDGDSVGWRPSDTVPLDANINSINIVFVSSCLLYSKMHGARFGKVMGPNLIIQHKVPTNGAYCGTQPQPLCSVVQGSMVELEPVNKFGGTYSFGPTASVADVACGTALWLVEVGRQIGPSSDLHGFDINLNQAPPAQWLPKNLKLHSWNLFEDVPQEFVGAFDIVHVRLITVLIKDNDPRKVMQNLYKLLKPGGYLQWDEVDVFRSFVVKAYPELEVPYMEAWCGWMSNPKKEHLTTMENEWKARAIDLLKDQGFEVANRHDMTDKFLQHMELMRYNNDQ